VLVVQGGHATSQYIDLFDLTIKYIRIVRWIERPYHHSYHSLRKEMIMNIAIQSSGLVLTEGLRAYVHRRLKTSLGWALTRRLAVWLSDINGPRRSRQTLQDPDQPRPRQDHRH
jgi:hypothetical protein